jgi:hypothetical protein
MTAFLLAQQLVVKHRKFNFRQPGSHFLQIKFDCHTKTIILFYDDMFILSVKILSALKHDIPNEL